MSLPFEPLTDYIAARLEIPWHTSNCRGCMNIPSVKNDNTNPVCFGPTRLAKLCRTGLTTVNSWQHHGLSWEWADEIAGRLGVHPSGIWGDLWRLDALTPLDDLYVHGGPGAEPGWRQAAYPEAS